MAKIEIEWTDELHENITKLLNYKMKNALNEESFKFYKSLNKEDYDKLATAIGRAYINNLMEESIKAQMKKDEEEKN